MARGSRSAVIRALATAVGLGFGVGSTSATAWDDVPKACSGVAAFIVPIAYPAEFYLGALNPVVSDAADRLEAFLNTQKACVRRLGPSETNADGLRAFFRHELPTATQPVVMLFVLGHGVAKEYPGSSLERDLMIVPNDSVESTPEASAIFVNQELIQGLAALPRATVALAYLDTCQSGAAVGSLSQVLSNELNRTMNLGVLGASTAGATAYGASFTNALVALWEKKKCIPDTRGDIAEALSAALGKPLDSDPYPIVRFPGGMCLADSLTLFGVVAGPEYKSGGATIFLNDVKVTSLQLRQDINGQGMLFFRVPRRGTYNLYVQRQGQNQASFGPVTIELKDSWFKCALLSENMPAEFAGSAYEKCASAATIAGIPAPEVFETQRASAEAYARARDSSGLARLTKAMDENPGAPTSWKQAKDVAQSNVQVASLTADPRLDEIAGHLAVRGSLGFAGDAWKAAGLRDGDPMAFKQGYAAQLVGRRAGGAAEMRRLCEARVGIACAVDWPTTPSYAEQLLYPGYLDPLAPLTPQVWRAKKD